MPKFRIPAGTGRSDFTEKKSRFIGEAVKALSPEEARSRIRELREQHPRARHVAWAYVLGHDGALVGLSDDGEPHGTAGRPILDPIQGAGLTETLVTVVRYFGGVKLGTGGLVSAYGRCAKEAVEALPKADLVERTRMEVRMDYPLFERIKRSAEEMDALIADEIFGAEVRLIADVPSAHAEEFIRIVADVSRGSAEVILSESG